MITLTLPIGPDLVAALAADAIKTGLPLDEHAENVLRGALGLPRYPREAVVVPGMGVSESPHEVICGKETTRVEEVSSAMHRLLRQSIDQKDREIASICKNVRRILPAVIRKSSDPAPKIAELAEAVEVLRHIASTAELYEPVVVRDEPGENPPATEYRDSPHFQDPKTM